MNAQQQPSTLAQRIWKDYVLATGGLTFFVSLIPSILDPSAAVPLASSLPTAATLLIFLSVYVDSKWWFALATGSLSALAWILIAIFRGF